MEKGESEGMLSQCVVTEQSNGLKWVYIIMVLCNPSQIKTN